MQQYQWPVKIFHIFIYSVYHWQLTAELHLITSTWELSCTSQFSSSWQNNPCFGSKLTIFITAIYLLLENPDEEIEIIDNFTDTSLILGLFRSSCHVSHWIPYFSSFWHFPKKTRKGTWVVKKFKTWYCVSVYKKIEKSMKIDCWKAIRSAAILKFLPT